ncbi:MAG: hypothetical protein IID42_10770 [Planctomycetes bacterium]|nr:hypothetical protein [Planctomycetota bacterium]
MRHSQQTQLGHTGHVDFTAGDNDANFRRVGYAVVVAYTDGVLSEPRL